MVVSHNPKVLQTSIHAVSTPAFTPVYVTQRVTESIAKVISEPERVGHIFLNDLKVPLGEEILHF